MDVTLYSFLQNIMLLGAIQGIIFSGYTFFSKKHNSLSNFFLGMLILWFSLNNIQYYLWKSGIVSRELFFGVIYFPYASSSMVFYYFYIKLFLFPKSPIPKKQWFLLLPCGIFFLLTLYYKIGNATDILSPNTILFFSGLTHFHEVFSVGFSLTLLIFTYNIILNFGRKQSAGTTQIPRLNLGWLKTISVILFILCLIWMLSIYVELSNSHEKDLLFYILWIGISFTIYILGHVGLHHSHVLQEQQNIHAFQRTHSVVTATKKTDGSQNKIIMAFEKFVKQDKNYLDSSLSLDTVAENLSINKSYLSRIINAETGKSFSDYVNELRVEEAKRYMANPDFSDYTLVSIGLEAGFNSKTTFNTTFKKTVGMTPSEFKKQLKKA